MTQAEILALDSKKHVKMWLLHQRGLSRKQIAALLGTNAGHVGNEIKDYQKSKNKAYQFLNQRKILFITLESWKISLFFGSYFI